MQEQTLLQTFLNEQADKNAFVAHQIDSFNDFVKRRLQRTINEIGKVTVELSSGEFLDIKFGAVTLSKPIIREANGSTRPILPQEARLRNLTYSSPLLVEMTPVFEGKAQETEVVEIGEIPIMVKSVLCPLSTMNKEELILAGEDPKDHGGHFIINGTERVVVLLEEVAPNRLIVQKDGDEFFARINSERGGYVQRHVFERKSNGVIVAKFANIVNTPIPIVALMKALGMETDKEIIEKVVTEGDSELEEIYTNIYEVEASTRDEAIDYIGRRMKVMQKEHRETRVLQLLDTYLLGNIGQKPEDRIKKARFLAIIMRKLIQVKQGTLTVDDIDHYANKRLKGVGDLFEDLLRSIILGRWGLVARLQYNYQKMMKRGRKFLKLQGVVVSDVLTKQIMRSMATGNWITGKTGVSQRLERSNFIRTTEHLRSVVSALSSTQEHFEARELHATHMGRLCCIRTPEGQNIGLRNFLAMGAKLTQPATDADNLKILTTIKALGVKTEN